MPIKNYTTSISEDKTVGEIMERPIIFSAPMVRALLRAEDPKTQTRRVAKPKCERGMDNFGRCERIKCPYGVPGERLWVRETYREPDTLEFLLYRADESRGVWPDFINPDIVKWTPAIFMPRGRSRINLEVTEIRAQRLQEISPEDCIAEGLSTTLREHDACCHLQEQYRQLWDSINGKRHPWISNPWIWALTFKRIA